MRARKVFDSCQDILLRPSVIGLVVYVALFRIWMLFVSTTSTFEEMESLILQPLALGLTLEQWMLFGMAFWGGLMVLELIRAARVPPAMRRVHVVIAGLGLALIVYLQVAVHVMTDAVGSLR